MNSSTFERRLATLIKEVQEHPYQAELLHLCNEQRIDDTTMVSFVTTPAITE